MRWAWRYSHRIVRHHHAIGEWAGPRSSKPFGCGCLRPASNLLVPTASARASRVALRHDDPRCSFSLRRPRFRGWSQYHKSRHCRTLRGRAHLGDRHCPLSEDNRSNFSSDKRPSHASFEILRYSSVTRSLPAVRIIGLKAIRRNKKSRYCNTLPRFGSSNLLR
jgi:hypothetical protein